MTRPASRAELAAMTEEQRTAYEAGRAFSYGECGLAPITGAAGAGVYVVQRALRETLTAMKDNNP